MQNYPGTEVRKDSAITFIGAVLFDMYEGGSFNGIAIQDNKGTPLAAANIKVEKDAIAVDPIGSVNTQATTELINAIEARAKEEGKSVIKIRDIQTKEAEAAFRKRGFSIQDKKDKLSGMLTLSKNIGDAPSN